MATKVLGLPKLQKKLLAFPQAAKEEIAKAMEESANEIVGMAKSLAQSSRVRNSIGWTYGDVPKGALAIGGIKSRAGILITIFAGSEEAFMARWEEFGTAPHTNAGIFSGTQHPGTAPRPYFFVSYRANRRRIKSRVSRAISRSAKKVAAGHR
jgi:hypothetical protein